MKYRYDIHLSGEPKSNEFDLKEQFTVLLSHPAFVYGEDNSSVSYGEFVERFQCILFQLEKPLSITSDEFIEKFMGSFYWFDEEERDLEADFKQALKYAMEKTYLSGFSLGGLSIWDTDIYVQSIERTLVPDGEVLYKMDYDLTKYNKTVIAVADELQYLWWKPKFDPPVAMYAGDNLNQVLYSTPLDVLDKVHSLIENTFKTNEELELEDLLQGKFAIPELASIIDQLKVKGL